MDAKYIVDRRLRMLSRRSNQYCQGYRQGMYALLINKITTTFMSIDQIKNQKEFEYQRGLFDGWLYVNKLRLDMKRIFTKSRKPKKRYASKSDAGVIDVD